MCLALSLGFFALKDKIQELDMESTPTVRETSPLARKIRMLENRLDKAMIKCNEAQGIGKSYEQIVKRLQVGLIGDVLFFSY